MESLRAPQLHFHFPLTAPCETRLMCRGPLRPGGFEHWLRDHPDLALKNTLIDIIRFGAKIGYTGPEQLIVGKNSTSAFKDPTAIAADIHKRSGLHQIQEIPAAQLPAKFISSPLSLTPKSDGSWRRIHNLSSPAGRSVNDHIPHDWGTLKFTHFDDAVNAIRLAGPGTTLVKRDLADAYRHIPVHPSDWWLLGFSWEGRYYIDQYLPFGLRTAPIIFDLFSSALESILRREGWDLTLHYLDDFLGIIPSHRAAPAFIRDFDRITAALGFKINTKKNDHGTCVTFLGIEIDTIAMEARLPPKKRANAVRQLKSILHARQVSFSDLESLTGSLAFAAGIAPTSRAFLRSLYELQQSHTRSRGSAIQLTPEAREDLLWWVSFLDVWNGKLRLSPPKRTFRIWISASGAGVGGYFLHDNQKEPADRSQTFSTRLPPAERASPIEQKTLLAAVHALTTWADQLRGSKVLLRCNNAAVTDAIRKNHIAGAARAPLRALAKLVAVGHVVLEVVCVPAGENRLAEALAGGDEGGVGEACPRLKNAGKDAGKEGRKGVEMRKGSVKDGGKSDSVKAVQKNKACQEGKQKPKVVVMTVAIVAKGQPKEKAKNRPMITVKEVLERKPKEAAKEAPKPKSKPKEPVTPKNKPQDLVKQKSKDEGKATENSKQKGTANDKPKKKPKDEVKTTPKDTSKQKVKDTAKQTPQNKPQNKPKDSVKPTPKDTPKSKPNAGKDAQKNKPNDKPNDKPKETRKETQKNNPNATAKDIPKPKPKEAPKPTPKATPKNKNKNDTVQNTAKPKPQAKANKPAASKK